MVTDEKYYTVMEEVLKRLYAKNGYGRLDYCDIENFLKGSSFNVTTDDIWNLLAGYVCDLGEVAETDSDTGWSSMSYDIELTPEIGIHLDGDYDGYEDRKLNWIELYDLGTENKKKEEDARRIAKNYIKKNPNLSVEDLLTKAFMEFELYV